MIFQISFTLMWGVYNLVLIWRDAIKTIMCKEEGFKLDRQKIKLDAGALDTETHIVRVRRGPLQYLI